MQLIVIWCNKNFEKVCLCNFDSILKFYGEFLIKCLLSGLSALVRKKLQKLLKKLYKEPIDNLFALYCTPRVMIKHIRRIFMDTCKNK